MINRLFREIIVEIIKSFSSKTDMLSFTSTSKYMRSIALENLQSLNRDGYVEDVKILDDIYRTSTRRTTKYLNRSLKSNNVLISSMLLSHRVVPDIKSISLSLLYSPLMYNDVRVASGATWSEILKYSIKNHHPTMFEKSYPKVDDPDYYLVLACNYQFSIAIRRFTEKASQRAINKSLSVSVSRNSPDIVKYLLNAGADVKREHVKKAIRLGYNDVVNNLVDYNYEFVNLAARSAAECGRIDIVQRMIEYGASNKKELLNIASRTNNIDLYNVIRCN